MRHSRLVLIAAASLFLQGCDEKPKRELPPRPVLAMVIAPTVASSEGFPGTVEPRYQSELAFRVLGRVIARNVKLGDQISKGQVLAALDPAALDFALRVAKADFESARAQLDNATSNEKRRKTLFDQGNLSAETYDAAKQTLEAAHASTQRARNALEKAQEQRSYAELRAEFDGVVTGIYTELGQVPTAGQKAISIAQPHVRDAVIDVPDDLVASIGIGQPVRIELQGGASAPIRGQVREITPQIDALTHTRRLKIALQDASDEFRLGTLITAFIEQSELRTTRVPISAIIDRGGKTSVWIVDPATATVAERPIEIADRDEQLASVRRGLEPGDRVVIAGVNSITSGQRVRLPRAARP